MKYIQTIVLSKQAEGIAFKKRAPRCIREIKRIAAKTTKIDDIRIGEDVNLFVWSKGIRAPPRKIRVQFEEKEEDQHKFVEVSFIDVESFKGLRQEKIE